MNRLIPLSTIEYFRQGNAMIGSVPPDDPPGFLNGTNTAGFFVISEAIRLNNTCIMPEKKTLIFLQAGSATLLLRNIRNWKISEIVI